MTIKFQDLETFTEHDVTRALLRNDPDELQFVSLTIALSDLDAGFIQSICIRLCTHENNRVRAHAFTSLGHLARRFRTLDERSVKNMVETALQEEDSYVRACAKAAADEIHQFLHWQIEGHVYG